jgi:predicted transcriptional regulator
VERADEKRKSVLDAMRENSRRKHVNKHKKIYSQCSAFHPESLTLVVSLIDKETKVYNLKQNGTKISLIG